MAEAFLKLLNMGITAGWIACGVMLVRLLLQRTPKWIRGFLWGIVALRLVLPFSFESALSLIPSKETFPADILTAPSPGIKSGIPIVNSVVNPIISQRLAPSVEESVNPAVAATEIASYLWLAGVVIMLTYAAISFLRVKRQVREAAKLSNNLWQCDTIETPFILGVIRPKNYLPSSIAEADAEYVISHERAHLKRLDHIWKPVGFLLLSVYWFNPILWVAYALLCRDIELACDERVLKQLGEDSKKPYSNALINCSAPKRVIAACPLAFGEVGTKERVKTVLNYKKPAFWVIVISIVACVITAICFLTNPTDKNQNTPSTTSSSQKTASPESEAETAELWEICPELAPERKDDYITHFMGIDGVYDGQNTGPTPELFERIIRLEIGKRPLSESETSDRDRSRNVVFQTDADTYSIEGYLHGTYVNFNRDFSEVWVDDGKKPSLSYKVMNPQKARELFEGFSEGLATEPTSSATLTGVGSDSSEVGIEVEKIESVNGELVLKIRWNNNSDKVITYGEPFEISKEENGQWTPLEAQTAWVLPTYPVNPLSIKDKEQRKINREHDYNLSQAYRLEKGRVYRFATDFRFLTDSGKGYKVWVDFVWEETDSHIVTYLYTNPSGFDKPYLSLSPENQSFQFCYSYFSSHIGRGKYEEAGNKLICETEDGDNTYTFKRKGNSLVFVADESSPMPKYRYGADVTEAVVCVPDGAVFEAT